APAGPARAVAGGEGGVACGQPRFSPAGDGLAFVCDRTGWMNVWVGDGDGGGAKPLLDDPAEHAEPTWGAGQRSYAWSPDGSAIAFCRNEGGFGRVVVADPAAPGARRVLATGAPGALVAAGPVEPEPVSWAGEDGSTVHGLLYR